jgi:hypothetical protein
MLDHFGISGFENLKCKPNPSLIKSLKREKEVFMCGSKFKFSELQSLGFQKSRGREIGISEKLKSSV